MAITYPATMPTTGVSSITWTNANASIISRSPFTFQGQVQSYPGAIRTANVSITDVMRDEAEDWLGFLDSLNGSRGTFLFGDPTATGFLGVGTGTPVIKGANQSGSTLVIDGATPSTNNWIRRGDWFQIGTGINSRLYKSTATRGSDTTGTVNIEIWPPLRITPVDDAFIYRNNPKGLFRLSAGAYDYTEDNSCRYTINFTCEEVI